MRKIAFTFLAFLFVLACNTSKKSNKTDEAKTYFTIQIEQAGEIISPVSNVISLKKKPFKFKVVMKGIEEIIVSASWAKFFYDYPLEKNIFECDMNGDLSQCRFVMAKVGAQTKFNKDKELMVGDDSYLQGWFYIDDIPFHRFDEGVSIEDNLIKAEFTVENIFDLDLRDKRLKNSNHEFKIEKIDKPIYLVFATSNYNKEQKSHTETQREKIILRFE